MGRKIQQFARLHSYRQGLDLSELQSHHCMTPEQ